MTACPICLIEDDEIMGGALALRFELEGHPCDWFKTGKSALAALRKNYYGAVVSDILLPDINGEKLYASLLQEGASLPPFVFMTGHGTVDQAVRLMKRGAVDYLIKPFEPDHLLNKLRELASCQETGAIDPDALGISPAMRVVEELLLKLAQSPATVLITGESGVGKERVASKLHWLRSQERERPFVAVNCGAFSESLLEAELFGYEKGAFTGAARTKRGLFEQANGGSLLLDEIGDMPMPMQLKLLRVLQERQVIRVGGEKALSVDFCLMAATHRDLRERVEKGLFREDLYYRINVIQLRVPPLRERREDILWLAGRFLDSPPENGVHKLLSPSAERALLAHDWPGNVRELQHVLERARVLSDGPLINPDMLFENQLAAPAQSPGDTLGDYLAQHEKEYIHRALVAQSWQIQETATILGISRKNLWEKMKKLDIRREIP